MLFMVLLESTVKKQAGILLFSHFQACSAHFPAPHSQKGSLSPLGMLHTSSGRTPHTSVSDSLTVEELPHICPWPLLSPTLCEETTLPSAAKPTPPPRHINCCSCSHSCCPSTPARAEKQQSAHQPPALPAGSSSPTHGTGRRFTMSSSRSTALHSQGCSNTDRCCNFSYCDR